MNADPPTTAPPDESRVTLAGVLLMLAAVGLRVLASFEPFPHWAGDPFSIPAPLVGVTPVTALGIDALLALGSAVALFGAVRSGHHRGWWGGLVLLPFAAVACVHARPEAKGAVDSVASCSAWISALAAGWAATHAGCDPRARRVLIAGVWAFVGLLAAKGLVQVAFEHPATVASFRSNREAFLASHGWSVDSPMALAYERRLMQPEASGWFGMANVYAGIAAAMAVALFGLFFARLWRREPFTSGPETDTGSRLVTWALVAGVLLALLAVYLADAKGGYACLVLGVAVLALARLTIRSRSVPSAVGWVLRRASTQRVLGLSLGIGAVAGIIAILATRGLIGTRWAELSLLFRSFYITTAAKIAAAHPWLGVGPGNFKDAYALLKPPISPEDVSSPHSILFDWCSMLGVAGAAVGVWWWTWVLSAGRSALEPPTSPMVAPSSLLRREAMLVAAALVVPLAVTVRLEASIMVPEAALARLLGFGVGVAVAVAVLVVLRDPAPRAAWGARAAVAAAALALAANAQFELTGTHVGSAAWGMLLIGTAGACPRASDPAISPTRTLRAASAALVPLLALAGVLGPSMDALSSWEHHLRRAYASAAVVGDLDARFREALQLPPGRARDDAVNAVIADLRAAHVEAGLPEPVVSSGVEMAHALMTLRARRASYAATALAEAARAQPSHFGTLAAWTRTELMIAQAERAAGRSADADRLVQAAVANGETHASAYPSSAAWGWVGTLAEAASREADNGTPWLVRATTAWERAVGYAPHGVIYPASLAKAYQRLGNAAAAAHWASVALANDRMAALDPLAGLNEADRAVMQRLAGVR